MDYNEAMALKTLIETITNSLGGAFWGLARERGEAARAAELAFWLAAAAVLAAVAWQRRRRLPYLPALAFLAAGAASALPLIGTFSSFFIRPSLAAASASTIAWLAYLWAANAFMEYSPGPGRRLVAALPAALAAGMELASALLPSEGLAVGAALGGGVVRASLGLLIINRLMHRGYGQALARRALPSASVWTASALALLIPLPAVAPYAQAAYAAGQALAAASVVFLAMAELGRASAENTALDDYALRLSDSMRRFIPGEFLAYLKKNDVIDLVLGDHVKKDMTIYFSDIRAFTELSEILTPEESFAFVNSYLSRVVPIIKEHRGFVDKYMGDGIMALFPEDQGADDAVSCSVAMQRKIQEYNGHRAKMGYRSISLGIGLHTGPLMMGVVGVSDRMEGTVISDSVNLASRLQSIAKAFNIPLVISERTFMSLSDPGQFKYRFIGKVRVRGKDAPVSVFEIFDGLIEELFDRKMRSNTFFEQGMMAYYQKEFNDGVFYFKRALEQVPEDGASRFYLETCLRKAMAPRGTAEKPRA